MKQKIILILAVVIGLIAAALTNSYLTAKDNEVKRWVANFNKKHAKVGAVCVKRDLPSGTVLTVKDLGAVDVMADAIRGHYIKEEDALSLVGRRTLRKLEKGAPVFWSDIEGGDPMSRGLAGDIKTRMRAISINVAGAASVSGMVRPNDHVDVLGTFSFPAKDGKQGEMELVTLTMLQDVLVLATGRDTAKSRLSSPALHGSAAYSAVTLEVTPREAEMLVFAEQIKGRLSLALRNPDDVYFEKSLPRVDFQKIQGEIEELNNYRQRQLLHKKIQ